MTYQDITGAVDAHLLSNILQLQNELRHEIKRRHIAGTIGREHRRIVIKHLIGRLRMFYEMERCCHQMRIVDDLDYDLF